ncbi:DoxX family protein [Aequorivita sp. SDUM287046]|uniref:DoxX family protein n=1 Tax=Aequorivita aurantiaca TaxID=3053356 RepID=A0ABT8DIW1_9FLAO|nr:DoxX family protein [Aequorivita aurantiaca]MDN3725327.1 DoxX family protein [Aequorivita aurantiaca]
MKKEMDLGLLLMRLAIGFPMLIYGISKIQNGIAFIKELLIGYGISPLLGYGVYIGEVVAPILIILGFRIRFAALIFAINCFSAIVLAQMDKVFALNDYGGWALELLAIYLIIAMALFFTGAGKYSLSK